MRRKSDAIDLPQLFAALADRTRLRLLNLIQGREVCVCYLVDVLEQSQPKVSRHLAYLRRAGIVRARREGKWMHYSIERPADTGAAAILEATLRSFDSDREMKSDLAKLGRVCCEMDARGIGADGTRIKNGLRREVRRDAAFGRGGAFGFPQGLKPVCFHSAFAARLKSCPVTSPASLIRPYGVATKSNRRSFAALRMTEHDE
jgi:ArsR family transcriptional regulator